MFGRFGRRYGAPWYREDWEGWTPPWMERGWRGPRGPRAFGGPGPHGPGPHGPGGYGWQWGSPEFQALRSEAAEVARLFVIASRTAIDNRERLGQLRSFLDRSRKELSDMIYSTGQAQTGSESGTPDVGQA
jgi:hypothetical protein